MDYAWEKLTQAVDALTGVGPLQERLVGAGIYLMRLDGDSFSDEHERLSWSAIMDRLTTTQDVDEGALQATTKTMSDDEVRSVARENANSIACMFCHCTTTPSGTSSYARVAASRRSGGTSEIEELWLVRDAGIGSLTLLCPRCAAADD